jgi:hypothetical protein
MERIKDAIEKAKQQRQAEPVVAAQEVVVEQQASKPTDELDDLSYEQTHTVSLDPKHLEEHRIVAVGKSDPASWAFDLLRTQVLQKMDENGWRTIGVISPTPEAGKSVVSINLAISIAHWTQKTAMVVDFDFRRPKVGSYLGLKMEKSMNEYLDGNADLPDVLVNPGIPRLVILPTRKPIPKAAEVLSSTKIDSLIKELRDRYTSRIVIFDLPPLLNVDDSIAVLPKLDCVLFVIGNGMSSKSELEESVRLLSASNMLGVVLNKANAETRAYYY